MDLVILAGGKSRRMGKAKALLDFDRATLIETVISRIRSLFDNVIIASATGDTYPRIDASEVCDIFPDCGSLGGLHAGLTAAGTDRIFALACDMPFVNPKLVTMLVNRSAGFDAVVPRTASKTENDSPNGAFYFEPLHAVYAKTCLPHMEQFLSTGNLRILDFFDRVNVDFVDADEIRTVDSQMLSFFNINTPEDFEAAKKLLSKEPDL